MHIPIQTFHFFAVVENIDNSIFGKQDWSTDFGRQRAGDSRGYFKKKFSFSGTLFTIQFLNCLNFVTIFCKVLKMKIFFKNIPSYPLPLPVQNSLTNQFYQRNWGSRFFKKERKRDKFFRESPEWISLFKLVTILVLKISRNLIVLAKIDWSMNSGRARAGDSKGYFEKKYFHFQTLQKMVTKLRQF